MKNKNLPEFLALMERYKTITIEEIQEAFEYDIHPDIELIKANVTGFGSVMSCTLCKAVTFIRNPDCQECVYANSSKKGFYCIKGKNKETYNLIRYAETPEELVIAYRKRAEFMQLILDIKEIPKP